MTAARYTLKWTETAVKMAEAVPDSRIRRTIVARVEGLAHSPEQQEKPLTGELTGLRSLRAAGQRFRLIYRVDPQDVIVLIVAIGRRVAGHRADIYELAKKLVRQGLTAR
jgi:mRNA interferase RelE/StbE